MRDIIYVDQTDVYDPNPLGTNEQTNGVVPYSYHVEPSHPHLGDTLFFSQYDIGEQPVHNAPVLHMQYQEEQRMTLNNEESGDNNDAMTATKPNNDIDPYNDSAVNEGHMQ